MGHEIHQSELIVAHFGGFSLIQLHPTSFLSNPPHCNTTNHDDLAIRIQYDKASGLNVMAENMWNVKLIKGFTNN